MGWTKRGAVRISALTPVQADQLPIIADKWNRIARCTDPIDKEQAASGIKKLYADHGAGSPRCSFGNANAIVRAWNTSWYVYDWRGKPQRALRQFYSLDFGEWGLRCRLNKYFEAPVLQQVESFMHRNVATGINLNRAAANLKDTREPQQTENSREHRRGYGQVDAPWLAIADYFAKVHNIESCEKLRGLMMAVANSGFVWLTPKKAVFINRPRFASFDERGRLHNEERTAVEFKDWGFCYLHGLAVDQKYIVTPADEINLEDLLKERNSDIRTAVLHKIGFARLLAHAKYKVISRANGNELIDLQLGLPRWNTQLRVLRLRWKDKTGEKETLLQVPQYVRDFGSDCPDNIRDCEQVRRWTLGWPKEALAIAET